MNFINLQVLLIFVEILDVKLLSWKTTAIFEDLFYFRQIIAIQSFFY